MALLLEEDSLLSETWKKTSEVLLYEQGRKTMEDEDEATKSD